VRFAIVSLWAAAILVLYEVRLPLDAAGAARATAGSLSHVWNGLPGALLSIPGTWAGIVWGVLVFLVSQAACLTVGRTLCEWLAPGLALSGRLRWLFTVLLGWLGAGVGLLGIAIVGLFGSVLLGFLTVVLLAGFLLPRPLHSLNWLLTRGYWTTLFPPGRDRLARVACAVTFGTLALTAVALLAPQTGDDDLARHLAIAGRIARLDRLVSLPANFVFDMPAHTELLRGWALSLGGEPAARLWLLETERSGR